MSADDRAALTRFSELYDIAEMYYAYSIIHTRKRQPFKTVSDATLFNATRFLLMRALGRDSLKGISVTDALLALAQGATDHGAFKLARFAYSKLQVSHPEPCRAVVACLHKAAHNSTGQ